MPPVQVADPHSHCIRFPHGPSAIMCEPAGFPMTFTTTLRPRRLRRSSSESTSSSTFLISHRDNSVPDAQALKGGRTPTAPSHNSIYLSPIHSIIHDDAASNPDLNFVASCSRVMTLIRLSGAQTQDVAPPQQAKVHDPCLALI